MRRWARAAGTAVSIVLLSVAAAVWTLSSAIQGVEANGISTLRLATASLEGQLRRYGALPALVADRPELVELLAAPNDAGRRRDANLYLAALARRLSVSDAYVMLPDGETIAASNHDAISFIGENFRYRPYFQDAATGGQGRFFGLGTTSDRRGFYFSEPIEVAGAVAGIIAFKIDLDPIEASWTSSDTEILVLDPENIVFMAARPEWRYRVFGSTDEAALARSSQIRRYASRPLQTIEIRPQRSFGGPATLLVGTGGEARGFLELRREMPEAGWTVVVLADTAPAVREALTAGLAVFFLLSLGGFLAVSARSRRRRARERETAEAAVKDRLERQVAQRTQALALANRRLEGEIEERRGAEARLRRTQSDLVEAGKLAALGQMSASLSHEFNQPLAAASAYADNAALLIERGEAGEALETVGRVAALLERLSAISRTLRNFARRPEDELVAVDVGAAVGDALAVVGHRLAAVGASVTVSPELSSLLVDAVAIRLQQVLVNLLSNAADAVEGQAVRRIGVGLAARGEGVVAIFVEDTGPGVPAALAPRIFDPFFTSKAVGKGLGLGLSISYNIVGDFGGRLRLETPGQSGARFVVELPARNAGLAEAAE